MCRWAGPSGTGPAAFALYLVFDLEALALVTATVFFAVAAGLTMWDLYEHDKASRKVCPECCEQVKVGARVCRTAATAGRWTSPRDLHVDYTVMAGIVTAGPGVLHASAAAPARRGAGRARCRRRCP